MADFKVSGNLTGQISNLRTAANSVNSSYDLPDASQVGSLQTANEIINQQKAIKALLDLYKAWLLKDAADLDGFVAEAEKMDAAIGANQK